MLGERLSELMIGVGGGIGDRVWALRELDGGRIASAKKHPRLLEFSVTYEVQPTGVFGVVQAPGGLVRIGDPVSLCE
jgi:uncharacterized protein YcbX